MGERRALRTLTPETVLKVRMASRRHWRASAAAAGAVPILRLEAKPNLKPTRSWFQR